MTIEQAQGRMFAELLKRELAGKSTLIQQIDIEHEGGGKVVAWVTSTTQRTKTIAFAVSFTPRLPIPEGEIRRLLTRDPLMVR